MTNDDIKEIKDRIQDAMDAVFSNFTWDDMIDGLECLSKEEQKWAKDNLTYMAVEY